MENRKRRWQKSTSLQEGDLVFGGQGNNFSSTLKYRDSEKHWNTHQQFMKDYAKMFDTGNARADEEARERVRSFAASCGIPEHMFSNSTGTLNKTEAEYRTKSNAMWDARGSTSPTKIEILTADIIYPDGRVIHKVIEVQVKKKR